MTHVEPSPQRVPAPPAGAFPNAWTLWRVRDVPVRVDRSWLLIAALVAWLFYGELQVNPATDAPVVSIALAVVCALLFFFSILAHELGHAMASLNRGIPVVAITLFAMGGLTESTREADTAKDEFVIVGIGPYISLVLAAVFGLIATGLASVPAAAVVAGYLGWTNLLLAVFNIVPGYPLDGGRLLRSILWRFTGAPHKSTRWAARVGQVFAALLILYGLASFVAPGMRGFGDLWNVFIGFFLFKGATDSHRRAQLRERLEHRTVAGVMGSVPPALPQSMTLAAALEQVQQRPSLLWPVGDPVQGVLLIGMIDDVPSHLWDTTTVAEVAADPAVATVTASTPLDQAVARMAGAPEHMLIVVDHGHPVGLLTPSLVSSQVE